MKKLFTLLILLLCLINVGFVTKVYAQAPATLPYNQDFSASNDFTFINGTQTNKWAYGSATGNAANSIYVSNNNGTSNSYTSNAESIVHAYRDISIPAGASIADFSFDWKGEGEGGYDFIKVWIVPATYTPAAGSLITAGAGRTQIGDEFNQQATWQTYSTPTLNISAYAGNTMRLVFEWKNDTSFGTNPAGAIDNISISIPTCIVPSSLSVPGGGPTSANLAWVAPSTVPANGYEYYYSTSNTAPTTATVGTANPGTSVGLSPLVSGTTYYWWVRSVCSGTDKSAWIAGPPFTPGQIGSGTGSTGNLPVYSCYGYNYSQQIYTAAEVSGAVGNNNFITSIKFYVDTTASTQANYNQWVVYMGNTTQNNFATASNWIPLGSLSQVYSGTLPAMTAGTWIEIPLATPFIWDGTSNLVIAVDENAPDYSCTGYWGSYNAGTNRGILYYNDNTNPDPASPPTATSRYSDIPKLQLIGQELLPCSTNPPSNIIVGNLTATTATVTWTPAVGATYKLQYRKVGTAAWIPVPGTIVSPGNSVIINGLTEQTQYEVQISTTCNGVQGPFSPSILFTTPAISYCNMTGNGTNDHISNVTMTSANGGVPPMSNTSVQTNYISYVTPATLINLDIGSTGNTISVSKGWTGGTNNDAVSAWIDFNRNGFFENNEQILASPANTTTPVTNTFDVPATSYNGALTTTMRVVLRRTNAPVMCQTPVANGEVEDYAVKLRPCSTTTPNAPTFTVTHNSAVINWTGSPTNISYLVQYRVLGSGPGWSNSIYASALLGNIPLSLTNLTPATTYEVQIAAVCGGTTGAFTAIKTFTTKCDPTPPNVTISAVTTNSAVIEWSPLAASSTYVMRYRVVGSGTPGWSANIPLPAAPANTYLLGSLNPYTSYEVQIANICDGTTTVNPWSNPKVFTTERTCELPPPGLTITNLTPTTAVVEWDAFPGATYILRYRKVGIPNWTNIPVANNTYTLTGLLELTKYEMQVVNICNGTPGTYTEPYFFTTPTVIYCQMTSANSTNEFISKVTVTPNGKPEMTNDSGASTYTSYTNVPETFIELIQGSTGNEISIEKSWVGATNDEGVAVWIDFNRNGSFDINERILASAPNTTSPVTGTFNVPADAFISMTDYKYVVMRVAMQKGAIPVNCTSFADGEVEDYTVRISKNPVASATNQTDILIYPNPVTSILNVKNISKKANYKIYNAAGQLISNGIILNNKIDVSKLINGVYVIDIEDNQVSVQKKFIKE